MNRGHAIGCPALRSGVPCVCWEIEDQAGRVRELELEWHGLQQMAGDQRKTIAALTAENERLREDITKHKDDRSYWAARCHEVILHNRALEAALGKYGVHMAPCRYGGTTLRVGPQVECSCGLAAAALTEPTPPAGEQG